jgi:hypothetical protein
MSNTVVIVDTAETENATDTSDLCNNTAATEVPQESEQVNKTESEQEVPQATDGSVGDANATEVSSAPMVPSSIAIITPATILPKQSFGSTADGDAPALTEREGPKSTVALDDGQITNNGEQASEKTIEKKKEKKSDGTSRKERISELLEAVSNLAAVTGTNEVTENMAADNATDASASSGSSDSTDAATDSAAGTANTEGTPAASTAVEAEVSSTTTVSEGQTRIPVVKVSDVDVTSKASISAEKTSENVSEKVPAKEASQMTAVKTSGVRDNEVPKKKISSSIATTVTPEIATLKVLGAGASEGVIQQATKAPKQFFGAPVDAKAIHIVGKELSTSATVSGGESTNLNEQVSEKEKSEKEIENSESLVGAGSTTPPVSGVDATAMEKIVSKSADVAAGESSAKVSKVQVNAKASEDTIAKGKKTKKKKKRKEKGPEEKKVGVVGSIAADDSPEVTSIPAKMDSSALPPSKTMRAVGYEAKAAATATKKLAFGSLSLKLPEVEVGTAKPLSPSAGSKPKVVVAKSSFETPAPAAAVTSVVSENLRIAALSGSKVGAPKVSGAKAGAAAVSGGQLEAPLNHDGLTNDLKKGKANDGAPPHHLATCLTFRLACQQVCVSISGLRTFDFSCAGDVENTLHPDEREVCPFYHRLRENYLSYVVTFCAAV